MAETATAKEASSKKRWPTFEDGQRIRPGHTVYRRHALAEDVTVTVAIKVEAIAFDDLGHPFLLHDGGRLLSPQGVLLFRSRRAALEDALDMLKARAASYEAWTVQARERIAVAEAAMAREAKPKARKVKPARNRDGKKR